MRETYRWTDIPHRQTGPDAHCWMDHSNMDGGNMETGWTNQTWKVTRG